MVFVLLVDCVGGEFAELVGGGEDACFAGVGVYLDDVAGFAGCVGVSGEVGETLAVGTPDDGGRSAAEDAALDLIDGADAGVGGGSCLGCCLGEERSGRKAEKEGGVQRERHKFVSSLQIENSTDKKRLTY